MSERRTDEIESGSSPDEWVTPTAAIASGGQTSRSGARKNELLLTGQVQALVADLKSWPTPVARDWRNDGDAPSAQARKSPCLSAAVEIADGRPAPESSNTPGKSPALWTTPCADDTGARKGKYAQGGTALSAQVKARLNHRWVAQLMGFPSDWLDDIDAPP
jgi:hypothetical protein